MPKVWHAHRHLAVLGLSRQNQSTVALSQEIQMRLAKQSGFAGHVVSVPTLQLSCSRRKAANERAQLLLCPELNACVSPTEVLTLHVMVVRGRVLWR